MAKSVDYKKESLKEWEKQVLKCSIALEGQDAVKAMAEALLPRSNGMDGAAYKHYHRRAAYINYAGKTVEAYKGAMHRKPAIVNKPASSNGAIDEIMKNIDLARNTIESSIKLTTGSIINTSRHALYLDHSEDLDRPYIRHIKGTQIINWTEDYYQGYYQPTMVVVKNQKEVSDPTDIFATDNVYDEYEVHLLREEGYEVQYWRNIKKGRKVEYVETRIPKPIGQQLKYIPMVCITPDGLTFDLKKPIIQDVVDINLLYYYEHSDYIWGGHWVTMPMLFFSGIPEDERNGIIMGGQNAVIADDADAKGGMIQYSGTSIPELRQHLLMLQDIISKVGASLLQAARKQPDTAEGITMKVAGESSILANLANTVEAGYNVILGWMAEWMGLKSSDISVNLNRDFVPDDWSAQDVKDWFDSLVMNAVTPDAYVNKMNMKEMYPSNFDTQAEIQRLKGLIESGQATMSNGVNQLTNMNTGRSRESNIDSISTNITNNG